LDCCMISEVHPLKGDFKEKKTNGRTAILNVI
jgi:hypothetical protein